MVHKDRIIIKEHIIDSKKHYIFVDIYTKIIENQEYWYNKFQDEREPVVPKIAKNGKSNNIANKKKSFFKQLIILIMRYIKLILNVLNVIKKYVWVQKLLIRR